MRGGYEMPLRWFNVPRQLRIPQEARRMADALPELRGVPDDPLSCFHCKRRQGYAGELPGADTVSGWICLWCVRVMDGYYRREKR